MDETQEAPIIDGLAIEDQFRFKKQELQNPGGNRDVMHHEAAEQLLIGGLNRATQAAAERLPEAWIDRLDRQIACLCRLTKTGDRGEKLERGVPIRGSQRQWACESLAGDEDQRCPEKESLQKDPEGRGSLEVGEQVISFAVVPVVILIEEDREGTLRFGSFRGSRQFLDETLRQPQVVSFREPLVREEGGVGQEDHPSLSCLKIGEERSRGILHVDDGCFEEGSRRLVPLEPFLFRSRGRGETWAREAEAGCVASRDQLMDGMGQVRRLAGSDLDAITTRR